MKAERANSFTRRGFGAAALALAGCGSASKPAAQEPAQHKMVSMETKPAGEVTIVEFSEDGKALGPETVEKVVLPEQEWQKRLSPLAYAVTREKGTEVAFTGKLYKNHEAGIYRCVACNTPLFRSENKFESHSGWPSFWTPIAEQNLYTEVDTSYGMRREEVLCKRCDAHLGHLFPDGPQPTGLRYCINSVSLKFDKYER